MQSSPSLGSYRHFRAYRNFKNPPQPHMCIQTTIESGEEIFINVLSWRRIVIPQEPNDPIPLYGGMRVISGVTRNSQLIFAVMANPDVLKYSGRHSEDPDERKAIIELMCDFVEAMNPDLKLARNGLILNDRDITGELKDIWNAVQVQRYREREEQISQQTRQSIRNATSLKYFSKSWNPCSDDDKLPIDNFENIEKICRDTSPTLDEKLENKFQPQHFDTKSYNNLLKINSTMSKSKEKVRTFKEDGLKNRQKIDGNEINMQFIQKVKSKEEIGSTTDLRPIINSSNVEVSHLQNFSDKIHLSAESSKDIPCLFKTSEISLQKKKEKFIGFLPNGSIFPRLKNNKLKNKDKDFKIKEKDKDKAFFNNLKKNKEKKFIRPNEKVCTSTNEIGIDFEKELQKLDLNKMDITNNKTFS